MKDNVSDSLTLNEIERRLFDLLASTFLDFQDYPEWFHEGVRVQLPFYKSLDKYAGLVFENSVNLPGRGGKWLLRLDMTGNGELYVDGSLYQAIDEYHKLVVIDPGEHTLRVTATPRRLFGENPWSLGFLGACAANVMWEEFNTVLAVMDLLSLAKQQETVREALTRAAARISVTPSLLQVYALARTLYGVSLHESSPEYRGLRWDYGYVASVYGPGVYKKILEDTPRPDPSRVQKTVGDVLEELRDLLSDTARTGRVYLFGHAHIDTAWLWPYSETRLKVRRTFSTVVRLAEMGYRFTFVQSGAQNYEWLESIDPLLFNKIKRLVQQGLWLPAGGMWVESDTQLLQGESLARQFLYGQRYFLEKFGRTCRIGWLPDSFGFSAQLPQILRKSGVDVFVTHKVMWNDTNEFPYHAFVWRGLDGSEVATHILVQTYNGVLRVEELQALWDKYKQKDVFPVAVHAYGFGDGGGGPTFTMLERLKLLEKLKLVPELVVAPKEEEYISTLTKSMGKLPVWEGEIYNEFHRGVYTTNLRVKQLVARAENEAMWSDYLSALAYLRGKRLPGSTQAYWKTILRNQFHDVLPGSSCREAYEEAYGELEDALQGLSDLSSSLVELLASEIQAPAGSIVVFNRLPWEAAYVVELPSCKYESPNLLACQELGGTAIAVVRIPSLGYTSLSPSLKPSVRGEARASHKDGKVILENEYLEVVIGREGLVESVMRKGDEFGFVKRTELLVHVDKPGVFDAWDIERSALRLPPDRLELVEGPKIIMSGPAVASATSIFKYNGSTVRITVSLYSGLEIAELKFVFDWVERSRLLKLWIETGVETDTAVCHVPFGAVKRPTRAVDRRTEAMFEVPALNWVDLSDGSRGLAILSVDRHGYSFDGSRVGVSLLKAASMPNPWSDMGMLETRVYLYPHKSNYHEGSVYRRAYEVLAGAKKTVKNSGDGSLPPNGSLLTVKDLLLEALKVSEAGDGVILRLYDLSGKGSKGLVSLPVVGDLYETDIVELHDKLLRDRVGEFFIELRPFEIKTVKFVPRQD